MIEVRDPEAPIEVSPLEPTTPIKPSEAIRLGCLISPNQGFGTMGSGDTTCALGAAAYGAGLTGDSMSGIYDDRRPISILTRLVLPQDSVGFESGRADRERDNRRMRRIIPNYRSASIWPTACPVHGCKRMDGGALVVHLNDTHRWKRERIADWLASVGL